MISSRNLSLSVTTKTLIFLGALTLISCAKTGAGSNTNAPNTDTETVSADTNTCSANFNKGSKYQTSLLSSTKIATAKFGKLYDENILQAVTAASNAQVAEFIQKELHLNLYRSNVETEKSCNPYLYLDTAPQDAQEYWDTASGGISKSSTLMGLYIPKASSKAPNASAAQPVIVIRSDVSKWTIVHEMMHHNFTITRELNGKESVEKLFSKFNQTLDDTFEQELKSLHGLTNKIEKQKLIATITPKLLRALSVLNELIEDTTLEEIAIEDVLIAKHQTGNLLFADEGVFSAYVYQANSAARAYKVLSPYIDLLNYIESIGANIKEIAPLIKKANEHREQLASRISEIRNTYTQASNAVFNHSTGTTSALSSALTSSTTVTNEVSKHGCANQFDTVLFNKANRLKSLLFY